MPNNIIVNFEKEIYKKYYPLVYSNCRRKLFDKNAIEDAVQSTFLMYIREQELIHSNLSSWLYWTSTNVCKVLNKSTKFQTNREEFQIQNIPSVKAPSFQDEESQNKLKNIMENLPKKKQEILLMRFFDDMNYSQISKHFNCSEESIRKLIERTLAKLRTKLNKNDIALSAIFVQFFGKNNNFEYVFSVTNSKSNELILQNTLQQQLIVKATQKMILFAKLKIGLVVLTCVILPLATIEVFNNTKQSLSGKSTDINTNINRSNKVDIIGTWKLISKSESFVHPIGSILKINSDGTSFHTQPNIPSTYSINDKEATFNFGKFSIRFNYILTENQLSLQGLDNSAQLKMVYEKILER